MPGTGRTLSRAREAGRVGSAYLEAAPPAPLLALLSGGQLLTAVAVALASTHNHFVWYSGGDATEYWTASWSLAHGEIGQTIVSYGIPVLYAWVPPLTGTTLFGGLPVIATLQLLVLVPLALVLFWAVGDRLFGRRFAWWATFVWILAPLLMLWGFSPAYATEFRELFLAPHWFGLTNMADLPSLVAVLATTWATLRLLERRTVEDGVLAGLLAGVTIGLKPANGFFLIALAILLCATRELRPLVAWGAAFLPALVTLALWKEKGLGHLPITSYAPSRVASGASPIVAASSNKYVHFNWGQLHHELSDLSQVFWSLRLLEFVAIAGALAVFRRDRLKGAFVAAWFVAFCLVKGSSERSEIVTLSYWRFVEPGLPAFVLLAAALVYLVPRRGEPFEAPRPSRPLPGGRRLLGAAAALLAGVPLLVVAVASPAASEHYSRVDALANDAPLSNELATTTSTSGQEVNLRWNRVDTGPTRSYYVVYRSAQGDGCQAPSQGAKECQLQMDPVGMTRDTTFTDRPGSGRHWYRIALMANYRDALDGSDLMLIGPATPAASDAR